ncbi:MAG TPA: pirin family protein [Rhodocyclaceae bacterium]|nr:pirin family protein [Rhodocyclaceae bacterium]
MPLSLIIRGREKDIGGGFIVRRLLPTAARQSVGPFVFFDHFGPITHRPEDNTDVRPHPHIGLATVTYLFDGAMDHRDSLGTFQRIEPGAINWMSSGRGIVHSERTPADLRDHSHVIHGSQLWAALPREFEETAPHFSHTPAEAIPEIDIEGARIRVLIGQAWHLRSPVETHMPTLYLHIKASAGARISLPADGNERATYCIDEAVEVDGQTVESRTMAVLEDAHDSELVMPKGGNAIVIGGAPLDGHRFMWWNFVSSSKERIERAKEDWRSQRMGHVAGDPEFIPLPES